MATVRTVQELRELLEGYHADTPVWIGDTVPEGSLEYLSHVRKHEVDVDTHTETFRIALPRERQRTETGLVFY